ncbi:unnamed protein product [Mycena citricolor]|uniref:Zn(2)-C6 fungal-type domain-containing protein n=1 Tax=Mycena citricolor TaxID=2018698 RepID=A0AAD2HL12_9AGAR|nr:unnamed protein product [Mycena citricolor]
MSPQTNEPKIKKRRIAGACDTCKKRKIRCDSGQQPGNKCTNCLSAGLECTHAEIMKTLGSAKGYVESLENRLEKMESLLNKLLPGIDFTEQFDKEEDPAAVEEASSLPRNDADHLLGAIQKLTLNPEEHRFFGKSSGIQFVQTALNFRSHVVGGTPPMITCPMPKRRKQYWEPVKWLLPRPDEEDNPQYTFPDADLLPVLIELYFTHVNCFYPTLHRPTFERKAKDNLHMRDHRFAATLLMVCSLGARHSEDPRVCLEGVPSMQSAGWKWHSQVQVIPKHLVYKPNLYELQTIALSSIFLAAISPVAWNQIGFGLRRAQDVGAHRRMKLDHPTADNEQWKRVFWVLLCLEWLAGTLAGRPLAMHEQDYDQELPVDCDDECWDRPAPLSFRQPAGKPSEISFFICYAKLFEIQAAVTSTIYSPRKARDLSGRALPPVSDAQNIVAFDSALNSWILEIPDHLTWDPERKNVLHLNQSALLHCGYYLVQIMVHRPYIPAPLETARPGALPSLAICTNAARSCARIIHTQNQLGLEPNHNMLAAAFTSAIVLLLHTWSGKRSGFAYDPEKEMEDVFKCMAALANAEARYQAAGRFHDILERLISVGDMSEWSKRYVEATAPARFQHGSASECTSSEPTVWPAQVPAESSGFYGANSSSYAFLPNSHGETGPATSYHLPLDAENLFQMPGNPDMNADADIMSMWSAAPSGFELADWESYIMNDPGANNPFLNFNNQFAPPSHSLPSKSV